MISQFPLFLLLHFPVLEFLFGSLKLSVVFFLIVSSSLSNFLIFDFFFLLEHSGQGYFKSDDSNIWSPTDLFLLSLVSDGPVHVILPFFIPAYFLVMY